MAQVFVTLHNDILSAPMKGGFALLDDKVSPALVDNSALFDFGEMARIGPWINKQGVLILDFVFDMGIKNARCVRNGRKGGKAAQIPTREGAIVSGAPPDASGQPTNKAAVDWLLMGAEEGTRDMTWEEIEEGADKLRVKGGKTAQIVARAGALVSGAPRDDYGKPSKKAAVDWMIMGAQEGTRGMTWEEIEEGADKLRVEGGDICKTSASRKRKREGALRGNDAMKVACLARGQDDCHSHACILPECGIFCAPELVVRARKKDTIRFRHGCQVAQKTRYGFSEHMCRNCHQTATQCKAAVCTYIACSRLQKFCEHLHAQEGAMKTFATEASAVQASVVLP